MDAISNILQGVMLAIICKYTCIMRFIGTYEMQKTARLDWI